MRKLNVVESRMMENEGQGLFLKAISRKFTLLREVDLKRSWLVRALDASERILKNMLDTTVIIRLPMDSLKGFGPSGFDPMKKFSKLSVPQPIR